MTGAAMLVGAVACQITEKLPLLENNVNPHKKPMRSAKYVMFLRMEIWQIFMNDKCHFINQN